MRKFAFIFSLLVLFLPEFLLFVSPKKIFADEPTCQITTDPSPVPPGSKKIDSLIIQTTGLNEGKKYNVLFNGVPIWQDNWGRTIRAEFLNINNTIDIKNLYISPGKAANIGGQTTEEFKSGESYNIDISNIEINPVVPLCQKPAQIQIGGSAAPKTDGCQIKIYPENPMPNNNISIKVFGLNKTNSPLLPFWEKDIQQRLVLKRDGKEVWNHCFNNSLLRESGKLIDETEPYNLNEENAIGEPIRLGNFELGTYTFEVRDTCAWGGFGEHLKCDTDGSFEITKDGKGNYTPKDVCSKREGNLKTGRCLEVNTGLGIPIATTPEGFIKSIFGIILGLAGGVALLLIIVSGFRLMTSQGNPEKVQGAKETLTSAIIGLVFIIFSFAILQIIGAQILKIPGFQ